MSDDFEFSEGEGTDPKPEPSPARRTRRGSSLPLPEPQDAPHSRETEEYLLSCCFLDGETTVERCRQAGITSASFHVPRHQIVFEAIVAARAAGKPVDVGLVSEDLRQSRQLEQIGGLPGLMEISGRVPTTAQASDFIQTVRRLEIRRTVLRNVTDLQEKCRNGVEIGDLVAVFASAGQAAADELDSLAPQNRLTARVYSSSLEIEKPEPIFTLAGTTISTAGNLTSLFAEAKGGKSAAVSGMISAALTNPTSGCDCLGFGGPNYAGHALIHLDTEQSRFDWKQFVERSVRRAALPALPPWLLSYNLTGMPAPDCRAFLEQAMREAKKRFGGIKAVLIDGTADLVTDPNDAEECFPLITRLHALAIEFNTAIVNVIHMNPGAVNTKGRGHLGSQLERKSESNLVLEKDGDGTTRIHATKQRGKMISRDDGPAFRWSDEQQAHVSCANPGTNPNGGGRPREHALSEYREAFPKTEAEAKGRSQIWRLASDLGTASERTFKAMLLEGARTGVIKTSQPGGGRKYYWPA